MIECLQRFSGLDFQNNNNRDEERGNQKDPQQKRVHSKKRYPTCEKNRDDRVDLCLPGHTPCLMPLSDERAECFIFQKLVMKFL